MELNIDWIPESPEDKLEYAKQEVANSTDVTPGMAEAITGKTWMEIFRLLRYFE